MNYYKIACKYVTPLFRIFYKYRIVNTEHLRQAARHGPVVICTTHSSDLGGMIVGMAVSMALDTEPWIVINAKFRRNRLLYFFLKNMNVIWIMGNDNHGNHLALKLLRDMLMKRNVKAMIIAPQGTYNRPDLKDMEFRQGFAIPCIQAARAGVTVSIVPALDIGTTYKGMPAPGRCIGAAFGAPLRVAGGDSRQRLAADLESAVRGLLAEHRSPH